PCQPSPEGVAGSACTSTFSRHARRSLALRPAHSRGHHFVTRYPKASDILSPPCLLRLLPAGANRRVGLAPTGKRRLVTAHPLCGHSLRSEADSLGCTYATFVRRLLRAHHRLPRVSFRGYYGRRRAPERHDGHWGLAAGARA